MDQSSLLKALLDELESVPDHEITDIVSGSHLVAVQSRKVGLASWVSHDHSRPPENLPIQYPFDSAKEAAQLLLSTNPIEAVIGLAALSSMLPTPPMELFLDVKAQEMILKYGKGRNVAVIGHFPFVEKIGGEFAQFWVLERHPRGEDLKAEEAQHVLPFADVVGITGTTLANGTLAGILNLVPPDSIKILIGPSTPLTPALFKAELDFLAGVLVEDADLLKLGICSGCRFKELKGIRHVVLRKSDY